MIVGEVNYSIENVLPYLAKELDVPQLIPCMGAEKYIEFIFLFFLLFNFCHKLLVSIPIQVYDWYLHLWN